VIFCAHRQQVLARLERLGQIQHGRLVPIVVLANNFSIEVDRSLVVASHCEHSLLGHIAEAELFAEVANVLFTCLASGPNPLLSRNRQRQADGAK